MRLPRWRLVLVLLPLCLGLPTAASAQPLGDNAWGLPGFVRVGSPTAGDGHVLGIAASAGYAATEPQADGQRWLHRARGSLGVCLSPAAWLSAGLLLDGRFDA